MELSADTATWVAVGVAGAAALLVLLLLVVVRTRRRASRELARETVEEVRRYVESALVRHAEEARPAELQRPETRLRRLSEVTLTVELDEVLERALRAATDLSGAAAAMLVVDGEVPPRLRTVGLSSEEVSRQPVGVPPVPPDARALELEYRYTNEEEANDEFRLRRGLIVPARTADGTSLATITVFWRRADRPLEEADVAFLEELCVFLVPALENARRFQGAQAAAWLDSETGLPNRRFFEDALRRECARARRYNHSLTLLVLGAGGNGRVTEAAAHVTAAVRASDVACRFGPTQLALVLPETALADAQTVCRRLEPAVAAELGSLQVGLVELGPEDDPDVLVARAEAALAEAA